MLTGFLGSQALCRPINGVLRSGIGGYGTANDVAWAVGDVEHIVRMSL
jgi:hypothetical protein